MAYSKLNLKNGQKLNATHLAHIEAGIAANEAELAKKALKTDIPDMSGYITDEELLDAIGGLNIPSVEGLATEKYVDDAIAAIPGVEVKEQKVVDLAIFMGQSNMAGRGVAAEAPVVPEGWGYEFRAMSDPTKLYPIVEPFGKTENNPASGVNESIKSGSMISAFAIEYYKQTGVPLVAVSCAQGNTSAEWWLPDNAPFKDAMTRHDKARTWLINNDYTIRHDFMVWNQGEADASKPAETYIDWMNTIVTEAKKHNIEKCFNARVGHNTEHDNYNNIINAQNVWCKNSSDAIMASCLAAGFRDLGLMKDIVHYTQEGYNIIGADAALHTAFYWKTGVEPYMLDPNEDTLYFPYADILAKVEADAVLNAESTNPIQNKAVATLMNSINSSIVALQERMAVIENGGEVVYYSVTYDLTNVTSSNPITSVVMGGNYGCVLTPSNGAAVLTNIVVTMGGADITLAVNSNGVITIPNVTGDIVITAIGEASDIEYLLNIDFTNTGVDSLISNGYMSADNADSSIALVQNEKGLYLNGAHPYGFKLANAITLPENWALEYTATLDSSDAGHTGVSGDCHFGLVGWAAATSPFVIIDKTAAQIRLDSSTARCSLSALHLVDDSEHTYRIEVRGTDMIGFRDGEQVSTGDWGNQGIASVRGKLDKLLGVNNSYINSINNGMFTTNGNHYIKSIKMWEL